MRKSYISALTLASLILAGCGGGSSGSSPVSDNGGSSSVAGTLSVAVASNSIAVTSGGTTTATVTLSGSTGVSNLAVTVAGADITGGTCTLSTATPTCTVTVTAASVGTAGVTADATGYTQATAALTVRNPYMFVTAATHNGAFGADAAAALTAMDAFCMADANKPANSGTFKAMIQSSVRTTSTDWVLAASQEYTRPDGTVIGTTNGSATFTFPLTDNITNPATYQPWTGMTNVWATSSNICTDWTDGTGSVNGQRGYSNNNSTFTISNGGAVCSMANPIYCVEQ